MGFDSLRRSSNELRLTLFILLLCGRLVEPVGHILQRQMAQEPLRGAELRRSGLRAGLDEQPQRAAERLPRRLVQFAVFFDHRRRRFETALLEVGQRPGVGACKYVKQRVGERDPLLVGQREDERADRLVDELV